MLVGPVFTLFYEQGWPSVSEWNAGGDYGQLILRSELFVQVKMEPVSFVFGCFYIEIAAIYVYDARM